MSSVLYYYNCIVTLLEKYFSRDRDKKLNFMTQNDHSSYPGPGVNIFSNVNIYLCSFINLSCANPTVI